MRSPLASQLRRFYDGGRPAREGDPGEPPDPSTDPRILLERHSESGVESFALERRIAYRDRHLGEFLVPADPVVFRTDLTSVPTIWTWLVPRTGAHLPAALVHDGLVDPTASAAVPGVGYVSTEGHRVNRIEADRVFRDAMADTGTGVVRRWLVWSAVTLATVMVGRDTGLTKVAQWRYRFTVVATLGVIVVLGAMATLDLFDVSGPPGLPWMGERVWWQELIGGLAGALTVPILLGTTWGRFRIAGWMTAVSLALLLHVTIGILVVTAAYQVAERLVRWLGPRALVVLAGVGALAAVTFLGFVFG